MVGDCLGQTGDGGSRHVLVAVQKVEHIAEGGAGQDDLGVLGAEADGHVQEGVLYKKGELLMNWLDKGEVS